MIILPNAENAIIPIENIRENLAKFPALEKPDLGYGKRYQVILKLAGANRKEANVLTGWMEDMETGNVVLTTAFVTKKEA